MTDCNFSEDKAARTNDATDGERDYLEHVRSRHISLAEIATCAAVIMVLFITLLGGPASESSTIDTTTVSAIDNAASGTGTEVFCNDDGYRHHPC